MSTKLQRTAIEIYIPTTTPKPVLNTKKPTIDMVNDYQPYVDFKFEFPEYSRKSTTRRFYLIVLVNSGSHGDLYRSRRDKIRKTWASRKTCEHVNAMKNSTVNNLKWILVSSLAKQAVRRMTKYRGSPKKTQRYDYRNNR